MPLYTEIPFSALKSQLAIALGDSGMVFFQSAEIGRYLHEALTTYQAISNYWRETAILNPIVDNRWTILSATSTNLVNSSGELVLQNQQSDRSLLSFILETLIENVPANFVATWGLSEQFTEAELITALNRVYYQFIETTGCLVRPITITISPNQEVFSLPERTFGVMAVSYIPINTTTRLPLYKTGRGDYDFTRGFGELTPGTPGSWSFDSDTLKLRIYPPCETIGVLEALVYKLPDQNLTPKTSETVLEIPPNLWWILKYGILADLLRHDGQSPDWSRAEYCQKRYEDGLELVKMGIPTILNARVNNRQVIQTDLLSADSHQPNWAQEIGLAERIIVGSWDLVSIVPVRRSGDLATSVELLLGQRVNLPLNDSAIIQLPQSVVQPILDYAKHIALLKISGQEFAQTLSAYPILFRAAAEFNSMVDANSRSLSFNKDKAEEARRKSFKVTEGSN